MCEECKVNGMKKKKRVKVSGFETDGMLRIAKKAGLATAGYAVGEYVNKALENTDKPDETPNAGLVGVGKCVAAVAIPSMVNNEMVEDACIGLFISGAKDIIVANAPELAGQIGINGTAYPSYYQPDPYNYNEGSAGGSNAGTPYRGADASGRRVRVAMY